MRASVKDRPFGQPISFLTQSLLIVMARTTEAFLPSRPAICQRSNEEFSKCLLHPITIGRQLQTLEGLTLPVIYNSRKRKLLLRVKL